LADSRLRGIAGKWAWVAFSVLSALTISVYLVLPRDSVAQAAVYLALEVAAALACLFAMALHRRWTLPFWLLAGNLVLWAIGDTIWDIYTFLLHQDAPYPSVADFAFTGGYPLLFVAMLVLVRGRGRPRLGDLLDGAIIGGGFALVLWVFLIHPAVGNGAPLFSGLVSAMYPAMDGLILLGLTQLAFSKGTRNASYNLFFGAFLILLTADVAYSYLVTSGAYVPGSLLDAGWMAVFAGWAIAALHPSMRHLGDVQRVPTHKFSLWRLGTLTAALLVVPILLEVNTSSTLDRRVLAGGAAFVTLTALARLALMWRERELVERRLWDSERRLRQLFQESEEHNDELRELDTLKDELLALVSHELRTPLTSIRGYLELVLEDTSQTLSADHREFLDVVDRNSNRLLRLVNDLLLLARVQAGRLEVETRPVDLNRIAAESVAAARPAGDRGMVTLSLHTRDRLIATVDPERVAQLIDNLLSNAIKFTPPGGGVDLIVSEEGESAVIEVADTGMGISVGEQDQLFTRFFRTRSATVAGIQGTGLGLAISKAIVEGHGGEIGVQSEEGVGTTFRVELPRGARALVEQVAGAVR
jgi:signal transduction histidine kinase